MSIALSLAALFVGFVTFSVYLLSQLWFNVFSAIDTIIGVAGLATSAGAFQLANRPSAAPVWVMWSSFAAVLGIVTNAVKYFLNLGISGNYYAWHINGLLLACLCFIGFIVRDRVSRSPTDA